MTKFVSVSDAKSRLSSLLDQVAAGEDIVITKRGKPLARLVSVEPRRPGLVEGRVTDDFFEPLKEDEIKSWQQ